MRAVPKKQKKMSKRRKEIGSMLSKILKSPIVNKLGREVWKKLWMCTKKCQTKVRNKKIRKILDSDLANMLVDKGSQCTINKLQ